MKAEALASYLMRFVGVRYYWSGVNDQQFGDDDPVMGFNCSGLVSEGLRSIGAIGPYERLTSGQIADRFAARVIWKRGSAKLPELQAGDMLFYGSSLSNIYHVTVAVSDWQMVEAGGGGAGIDTDEEAAVANAFVRVRPVTFRASELQRIIRLED